MYTSQDRRYQVFVSSTFKDLQSERQEILQVLLEMDCIPAAMELFPSADETIWSLIKGVIEDSDYYVVIVGGRYGSVTPEGISYTEKEYDYAVELGKPVLGFIHADPESLPVRDSEVDSATRGMLDRFRQKVMSRPVRSYRSADDLGSILSRSLMQAIRKQPGEGWIRGRFAASADHEQEVSRLRADLAEARLQLERAGETQRMHPLQDTDDLAQGSDKVTVRAYVKIDDKSAFSGPLDFTWDDLFRTIAPSLIPSARESVLASLIDEKIREKWPEVRVGEYQPHLSVDDRVKVLQQFRALGLIRPIELAGRPGWEITEAGEFLTLKIFAIRRGEEFGDDSST